MFGSEVHDPLSTVGWHVWQGLAGLASPDAYRTPAIVHPAAASGATTASCPAPASADSLPVRPDPDVADAGWSVEPELL
jgi:hypothetical protein